MEYERGFEADIWRETTTHNERFTFRDKSGAVEKLLELMTPGQRMGVLAMYQQRYCMVCAAEQSRCLCVIGATAKE